MNPDPLYSNFFHVLCRIAHEYIGIPSVSDRVSAYEPNALSQVEGVPSAPARFEDRLKTRTRSLLPRTRKSQGRCPPNCQYRLLRQCAQANVRIEERSVLAPPCPLE